MTVRESIRARVSILRRSDGLDCHFTGPTNEQQFPIETREAILRECEEFGKRQMCPSNPVLILWVGGAARYVVLFYRRDFRWIIHYYNRQAARFTSGLPFSGSRNEAWAIMSDKARLYWHAEEET